MLSRSIAWLSGIVIGVALVLLVAMEIDQRNAPAIEIEVAQKSNAIQVEIAGAVAEPAVYRLGQGDRVIDLIDAAGGLLPGADTSGLNQAAFLADGQKITVPLADEPDVPDSIASPEAILATNLNRASLSELMALPGIGEVRAQAIIDFRNQHGPFESVDELLFVDGISHSLLEELRPFISVEP